MILIWNNILYEYRSINISKDIIYYLLLFIYYTFRMLIEIYFSNGTVD